MPKVFHGKNSQGKYYLKFVNSEINGFTLVDSLQHWGGVATACSALQPSDLKVRPDSMPSYMNTDNGFMLKFNNETDANAYLAKVFKNPNSITRVADGPAAVIAPPRPIIPQMQMQPPPAMAAPSFNFEYGKEIKGGIVKATTIKLKDDVSTKILAGNKTDGQAKLLAIMTFIEKNVPNSIRDTSTGIVKFPRDIKGTEINAFDDALSQALKVNLGVKQEGGKTFITIDTPTNGVITGKEAKVFAELIRGKLAGDMMTGSSYKIEIDPRNADAALAQIAKGIGFLGLIAERNTQPENRNRQELG